MFAKLSAEKETRMTTTPLKKRRASFDVCQAGCGEIKLDRMPNDLERAKKTYRRKQYDW